MFSTFNLNNMKTLLEVFCILWFVINIRLRLSSCLTAKDNSDKFERIVVEDSLEEDNICEIQKCNRELVETIPEDLNYTSTSKIFLDTYKAWVKLLSLAKTEIQLASSYWTLRFNDTSMRSFNYRSIDWKGQDIYNRLVKISKKANLNVQIAFSKPNNGKKLADIQDLSVLQNIQTRELDFKRLVGSGILHTKLWIVDRKHFYVGSANFDWRSLAQVKEMGVLVTDCPCLAQDMSKIFQIYWQLGQNNHTIIPKQWPKNVWTNYNVETPFRLDDPKTEVFLASSPGRICPPGRTSDLEALLNVIDSSRRFIYIAVMDYFPTTLYTKHKMFWPIIDNHLRKAAIERRVEVRLLMSKWNHTRPAMKFYLKSLMSLDGIQNGRVKIKAKFFEVPTFTPEQAKIPFARVNHNKYMVTDNSGYIGTSNWSADYFLYTGGISFVFKPLNETTTRNLRKDLESVFERDWKSAFAHQINE